jgi:hypothetical protein
VDVVHGSDVAFASSRPRKSALRFIHRFVRGAPIDTVTRGTG